MPVTIGKAGTGQTLQRQLYDQLRALISSGRLRPGARLPATRSFAESIGVSRNTVSAVIEDLKAEGYIVTVVGSGCYVAENAPTDDARRDLGNGDKESRPKGNRSISGRIERTGEPLPDPRLDLSLFPMLPDVTMIDRVAWSEILRGVAAKAPPRGQVYWVDQDDRELRRVVSELMGHIRGVISDPSQVMLTSGNRQSLEFLAKALLKPGDTVWVEDPGMPEVARIIEANSAKAVPVPLDEEGLDVAKGATLDPNAKMIVIAPTQQLPTNLGMTRERRRELLDWAAAHDAWIVEIDSVSFFRYGGASKQGLYFDAFEREGRAGRVFNLCSLKTLIHPNFGLGFLIAPIDLADGLREIKNQLLDPASYIQQQAFIQFVEGGDFSAHLRRQRHAYWGRRNRMIEILQRDFSDALLPEWQESGMHMLAWFTPKLREKITEGALIETARESGLYLRGLSHYCREVAMPDALVLGFTASHEKAMEAALGKLRALIPS